MAFYHSKFASKRKKKKPLLKYLFWFLILLILAGAAGGYLLYNIIFKPNVWTPDGKSTTINIPSNSDFEDVSTILFEKGLIIHRNNFIWLSKKKNYPNLIKSGHYIIENNISNNKLINKLRAGDQTPINIIFNNIKNIYQLAGVVSKQIEADSSSIVNEILSPEFLTKTGLTKENIEIVFIPNTYEIYWNTSAKGFVNRMYEEYQSYWNVSRRQKAAELNLTIPEVVTLASIVEKETNKDTEKPMIAGVYVNRLQKGWRLQADPTILYILDDTSIKRVLTKHTEIDSPYNTYLYGGLPPGPICIPSLASVNAVLNNLNDGYLYFCAKDDLSGYHVFARSNAQHNRNARKYQKALNKLKIYK